MDRLRTLRAALADGALTQEQFAAERLAILDALLPAQPRERARLMPPPTLPAEGQVAEDRVRAMRAAGLVSPADLGAETAAIQRSLRAAVPKPATAARPATAGERAANGVHLASYKSEAAAREAWKDLTRRFPTLQGLSPRVVQTDLGAKGVFMRLEAGPVSSPQALCQSLKQAGQYCAPVAL
ncbi:hypothetical protein [Pararhodospirillum photometricum]|uniref:hypothetical protein n=1 Tax=Pararhodospirillum photometricum TaxID=1084 RepID=UPI0006841185|nr:hypothetical protein [Pararhodospirillum photometricum]